MSDKPKQNLPKSGQGTAENSNHAERLDQKAEIVHPDGTKEDVILRAERIWSGALPRPEDFAKYALTVPDAPERILRMAEKEQQHRIHLESQILPGNLSAARRGQWLGAGISALALILSVVAHSLGAPWQVSVALVGVPVLSVARSLVNAFKQRPDGET